VGPRSGLDRCGNIAPIGVRSSYRPARSQSLYRLSYQAHLIGSYTVLNRIILYVCYESVFLKLTHTLDIIYAFISIMEIQLSDLASLEMEIFYT
jgi:hypothetical protein